MVYGAIYTEETEIKLEDKRTPQEQRIYDVFRQHTKEDFAAIRRVEKRGSRFIKTEEHKKKIAESVKEYWKRKAASKNDIVSS